MTNPTEAEVQTCWKNAVNVLEKVRGFADDSVATIGSGYLDTLSLSLKGQYLPSELQGFAQAMRAGLSDLVSPNMATTVLTPILFEYGNVISQTSTSTYQTVGQGNNYRNGVELFRTLFEWMARPTASVGTSTSVTGTTLVDSTKTWTTNQWAGYTVMTGGVRGIVASNTATTLTLTGSNWNSATPAASQLYYIWVPITVASREITFDTTFDKYGVGGTVVGDSNIARLTKDAYGYDIEAVNVEQKTIRCRSDQVTGTEKWAEVWEINGTASSYDNLLRKEFGSGETNRTTFVGKHAGTGSGGSLLTNSSFSEYSASATPKFTSWTETAGGTALSQDTTTVYRSHPGGQTTASLKITGTGSTVTITQPLTAMRVRRIDQNTPYFFRIMVRTNTANQATSGTIKITLGSKTKSQAVSGLTADQWMEVRIGSTSPTDCWPMNFNTDSLSVQIEWTTSESGKVIYIDDAIFCPWDLVDGTYWCLRPDGTASPTAHRVDDVFVCKDTQSDKTKGKLQYWNWVSGYGYLPHSTSPVIADPT